MTKILILTKKSAGPFFTLCAICLLCVCGPGLTTVQAKKKAKEEPKASDTQPDTLPRSAEGSRYDVKDLSDLKARLNQAKPGDVLVLPAETLENWAVEIDKVSGTKEAPITIQGHSTGKTVFAKNGRVQFNGSSYVHVKDIAFKRSNGVGFNGSRYCAVINCLFEDHKGGTIVTVRGKGLQNRIEFCHFKKSATKNIVISVSNGSTPKETIIRGNTFEDIAPIGGNGRETIQIGQSQTTAGHVKVNTLVENNRFIRCNGEAEIISNKSSGNRYIGNLFRDCEGELVMRGGFGCTIENNRFENCLGGIRLSGKDHIVRNNVIWKSRKTGIRILYGVSDKAPAFYMAVSGCIIENNTVVNAQGDGILIGDSRGKKLKDKGNPKKYGTNFDMIIAPRKNVIRFNVVYGQKSHLLTVDQAMDNTISDNLVYSPKGKVPAALGKNRFQKLTFANLEKGDLTLTISGKGSTKPGATGSACKVNETGSDPFNSLFETVDTISPGVK
jgi:poly(beta-D-mannuronate) lyase